MKTLIIILFLTTSLFSQDFFSVEKGSQVVVSLSSGVFSALADYYNLEKHKTKGDLRISNDKKYHNYQFLERVSFVGIGLTIGLSSKFKIWHLLSDTFLSASYFLLAQTITQNLQRGKPAFWQSDYQKEHNTSGFDGVYSPALVIGCVILSTALNYIVYEIIN
jgi:hypothetical protein